MAHDEWFVLWLMLLDSCLQYPNILPQTTFCIISIVVEGKVIAYFFETEMVLTSANKQTLLNLFCVNCCQNTR